MDINDARAARATMIRQIAQAIAHFESTTELFVGELSLYRKPNEDLQNLGEPLISVHVVLPQARNKAYD